MNDEQYSKVMSNIHVLLRQIDPRYQMTITNEPCWRVIRICFKWDGEICKYSSCLWDYSENSFEDESLTSLIESLADIRDKIINTEIKRKQENNDED